MIDQELGENVKGWIIKDKLIRGKELRKDGWINEDG